MMKKWFLFLACFYIFSAGLSADESIPTLNTQPIHNGTLYILELPKNTSLFDTQKAFPLIKHPKIKNKQIALIGIPYRQQMPMLLFSKAPNEQPIGEIFITQKPYKQEKIRVNPSKVEYPEEIANRIAKERDEALAIYQTITSKQLWKKPFITPLDSVITSAYGNARIFNDTLQSFHTGTDFRAAMQTPIKASNDGVVVLVSERYLSGNSIIINHGKGIYSAYFHLDSFKVKPNQKVKQGQIIALSGNTGRSSGPHLHFSIVVNGAIIDPIDFIAKTSAIFGE